MLRYGRLAGRGYRRSAGKAAMTIDAAATIIVHVAAAVLNGDDISVSMNPCNSARRCAAFPRRQVLSGCCVVMSCLFCRGYFLGSKFQIAAQRFVSVG